MLDKPKPAQAAGGKTQKQASLQSSSKAKLVRIDTSSGRLDDLLTRFRWWKHEVMQVLLKAEYQRSQAAQRQKMLANLDESLKAGPQVRKVYLLFRKKSSTSGKTFFIYLIYIFFFFWVGGGGVGGV